MFSLPGVTDAPAQDGGDSDWALAAGAVLTNALLCVLGAAGGVAAYQQQTSRGSGQGVPGGGVTVPGVAGVACVVLPAYAAPLTIGVAAEALLRVGESGATLFFAAAAAAALASMAPVLWATRRAARSLPSWDVHRGVPLPAVPADGGPASPNASALQTVFGHVLLGGLRSYPNPWFVRALVAIEAGIATLLATATAVVSDCGARALVALAITLGALAYAACVRPLASRLETAFNAAIAALQCAAALAAVLRALVFTASGDRASAQAALELCVLVDAVLLFAQPVTLIVWELLQRRRGAAGDRGPEERAALSDALLIVPAPSTPGHGLASEQAQRKRSSSQHTGEADIRAPENPLLPAKN
jgi:hypothetical protein